MSTISKAEFEINMKLSNLTIEANKIELIIDTKINQIKSLEMQNRILEEEMNSLMVAQEKEKSDLIKKKAHARYMYAKEHNTNFVPKKCRLFPNCTRSDCTYYHPGDDNTQDNGGY